MQQNQKPTTQRDGYGSSDDRAGRISGRDRGVSEIIGAILLFGLLIAVLVLIQANAVPDANKQLEFQHNERVHGDFVDLDADFEATAATGNGRATVVETGLRYPPRFFLFNPPPAEGAIRTGAAEFTIQNAVAQGNDETDDYWDGGVADPDRFVYESRTVSYQPSYNVYANAPVTTYAHGAVVNRFEDGTLRPVDDAAFVNGRTVSLVALDGDRDVSQVEPLSLEASPLSTDTRTVRMTNAPDSSIQIQLSSDLTAAEWESLLDDQICEDANDNDLCDLRENADPDDDPTGRIVDVGTDGGVPTITLERGVTYEFQLAKLGVGPGASDPAPAYLTTATPDGVFLETGTASTLSVEVRDAFNGPVAGEEVTFTASGGSVDETTVVTDDQGQATVQFTPTVNGNPTLTAEADLDDSGTIEPHEEVTIDVDPRDEGTDDNTLNPIGSDSIIKYRDATVVTQGQDDFVDVEFENTGDTEIAVSAMRVNYYFTGSTGAAPSRPEEPDTAVLRSLDDEELEIRGGFQPVTWSLPGEQTTTLRIEFTGPPQNPNSPNADDNYEITELDFFILTVEYPNGQVTSYIIGPE